MKKRASKEIDCNGMIRGQHLEFLKEDCSLIVVESLAVIVTTSIPIIVTASTTPIPIPARLKPITSFILIVPRPFDTVGYPGVLQRLVAKFPGKGWYFVHSHHRIRRRHRRVVATSIVGSYNSSPPLEELNRQ